MKIFILGEPAMTGTATLTVIVGDINDNAPELDLPEYPPVVPMYTSPGTLVAEIPIIDRDGPDNGPPFVLEACQSTNVGCFDFDFSLTGTGMYDEMKAMHQSAAHYNLLVPLPI